MRDGESFCWRHISAKPSEPKPSKQTTPKIEKGVNWLTGEGLINKGVLDVWCKTGKYDLLELGRHIFGKRFKFDDAKIGGNERCISFMNSFWLDLYWYTYDLIRYISAGDFGMVCSV